MESRNKKFLIIYTVFIGFAITMLIINTLTGTGSSLKYIPFNNFFLEYTYTFLLLPLAAAFFGFGIAHVLSPLMLFSHKKTVGRKYKFGIYKQAESQGYKKIYFKGIYPVLMAMNLAVGYSENLDVRAFMVNTTPVEGISAGFNTLMALIPLMLFLSLALFSSAWFLDDVSVIYTNSEKIVNDGGTIEVKSVSGWYVNILKGYTGVTTIIVIGQILVEFAIYSISSGYYGQLFAVFMYPFIPIGLSFVISPLFKLMEATREKRKNRLLNRSNKLGIIETMSVKIE